MLRKLKMADAHCVSPQGRTLCAWPSTNTIHGARNITALGLQAASLIIKDELGKKKDKRTAMTRASEGATSPADCNRRPTRQPERNSPPRLDWTTRSQRGAVRAGRTRTRASQLPPILPSIYHRQVGHQPSRYPTTAQKTPQVIDSGAPSSLHPITRANHRPTETGPHRPLARGPHRSPRRHVRGRSALYKRHVDRRLAVAASPTALPSSSGEL